MSRLFQSLTRPMTSQALDAKAGQFVCWLVSVLVLVIGMLKLCRLPVNETELFFGVLLVLAVSLLMALAGLVLPMATRETMTTNNNTTPLDRQSRG